MLTRMSIRPKALHDLLGQGGNSHRASEVGGEALGRTTCCGELLNGCVEVRLFTSDERQRRAELTERCRAVPGPRFSHRPRLAGRAKLQRVLSARRRVDCRRQYQQSEGRPQSLLGPRMISCRPTTRRRCLFRFRQPRLLSRRPPTRRPVPRSGGGGAVDLSLLTVLAGAAGFAVRRRSNS